MATPTHPKHKHKRKRAPTHTFILNGKQIHVNCPADVRLLWVLRDLLHVNGPKYGCGLMVCKACTCLINGRARQVCGVPVGQLEACDHVVTIEGLARSVGKELHPMQQAWLDYDVAQCGYCQPGQIMDAVGLVNDVHSEGRQVTDADLDRFRNVCRCGTYPRIRAAILQAAKEMHASAELQCTPHGKANRKTSLKRKPPAFTG